MRVLDGLSDEVLSGSVSWGCRVASWLGSTWLGDVPVVSGRVVSRVPRSAGDVQHTLTLAVPRADGRDWRPGIDPGHPLARFGQQLDVTVLVGSSVTGQVWEVHVGRFLVTGWDDDDAGTVSVSGESLLRRVAEDRPATLRAPVPGGTMASEARRIMPPGIGLSVDPTLSDRTVPSSMAWSTDRLAALTEIADAWPALLRIDEWGQVVMRAPLPAVPSPIVTLHDGARGTLVSAPRADTRDDAPNRVVARSSAAGTEDVQAVAEVTSGPMRISGPYGAVTREWSSPLIATTAAAKAAASTMLRRLTDPSRSMSALVAPDPRLQLDDPVALVTTRDDQAETVWGWVTGIDLPLTVRDIGEGMRLDVAVSA